MVFSGVSVCCEGLKNKLNESGIKFLYSVELVLSVKLVGVAHVLVVVQHIIE